jgi:dipeptidase E
MKLLLLSNSTNHGEAYLAYSKKSIKSFLGDTYKNIVFIPFAGVSISWDEYTDKVNESLRKVAIQVHGIHRSSNPIDTINKAEAIVVGGGNSFQLLHFLYEYELLEVIKTKVSEGVPYIGWSAGSNVACPSIQTTNDMPIVEPPTLRALNLVPFQINPHYTENVIPDHGGESRALRLMEFIRVNKNTTVIGLPEGMMIQLKDKNYELFGNKPVKIFRYGKDPYIINSSDELNSIINKI